jgi:pyridoxamine 5'-phosphate oxidase
LFSLSFCGLRYSPNHWSTADTRIRANPLQGLRVAYSEFLSWSMMDLWSRLRLKTVGCWIISLQRNVAPSFLTEMEIPHDPAVSRYNHVGKGLRRSDLDPNPIRQFANWFTAAIEAGIRDVNAMSLATAERDARPSVRIVLLKSFDQDGFVFFTNYDSTKGKQLEANPYAALGFYWIELDWQIRISGKVKRTSREESQAYFHSRPVGSQLGAWASRQSEIIDGRRVLDARMAEITERFRNKPVPLPPHWGGYRLKPHTVEFWQGRPNRLHDRFRYTRLADGSWQIDRLAP